MRHELHFCEQRIGCTGCGVLQASFKTYDGTLWVNFAGDAPPGIARQPQSLLYLLLLLAWLFHSRQRILHDEDARKASGGCELALMLDCSPSKFADHFAVSRSKAKVQLKHVHAGFAEESRRKLLDPSAATITSG